MVQSCYGRADTEDKAKKILKRTTHVKGKVAPALN